QEDPHDLDDLFPAPALPDGFLALGQLVGNLQVHVLGHIRTSSPSPGRSCATSWRCGLCSRPRTTIRWLVDRSLSPCWHGDYRTSGRPHPLRVMIPAGSGAPTQATRHSGPVPTRLVSLWRGLAHRPSW